MIEHQRNTLEGIVTPHGMLKWRHLPIRGAIGIRSMLQQIANAIRVVPIGFPYQQRRHAVVVELPTLDQSFHRTVVVRLRRVVGRLIVIGVRAALEQQTRHRGVVCDTRCAINRGLEHRRPVVRLVVSSVRIGPRIEQRCRSPHERVAPRFVESQESREAQICERVPIERATLARCICRVECDQVAHSGVIAQHCGHEDVCARPFAGNRRICREHCTRLGERSTRVVTLPRH